MNKHICKQAFSDSIDRYTGWHRFSKGDLAIYDKIPILIIYLTKIFRNACTKMFITFQKTIRNNININIGKGR